MNEAIELLSTLSTREKKYISNQLHKTGKNQLLEKYNELKQYSKSKILFNKSKEEKAKSALLSFQLKEFVLEVLVTYKQSKTIEIEFRQQLSEIEFLKSKFLHAQALKKIGLLKSKLLKHERFSFLTQLLLIETEIQYFNLSEYHFGLKIDETIKQYNNYNDKSNAFSTSKIQFYTQLAGISMVSINNLYNASELTINKTENRSANYFYLRSSLIRSLTSNNIESAVNISNELIESIKVNAHEFDRSPFQKMDIYFMSGLALLLGGKKLDYIHCVDHINSIYDSNQILVVKFKERINYLFWVKASISKSKSSKELELIETFRTIRSDISPEFNLRITEQISNYFIDRKAFVVANKWNSEILNKPKILRRIQFIKRAKLRAIYIAIEQKKMDLAETFISRILLSKKDLNLNESMVLLLKEFNKKLPKLQTEVYKTIHFWKN